MAAETEPLEVEATLCLSLTHALTTDEPSGFIRYGKALAQFSAHPAVRSLSQTLLTQQFQQLVKEAVSRGLVEEAKYQGLTYLRDLSRFFLPVIGDQQHQYVLILKGILDTEEYRPLPFAALHQTLGIAEKSSWFSVVNRLISDLGIVERTGTPQIYRYRLGPTRTYAVRKQKGKVATRRIDLDKEAAIPLPPASAQTAPAPAPEETVPAAGPILPGRDLCQTELQNLCQKLELEEQIKTILGEMETALLPLHSPEEINRFLQPVRAAHSRPSTKQDRAAVERTIALLQQMG